MLIVLCLCLCRTLHYTSLFRHSSFIACAYVASQNQDRILRTSAVDDACVKRIHTELSSVANKPYSKQASAKRAARSKKRILEKKQVSGQCLVICYWIVDRPSFEMNNTVDNIEQSWQQVFVQCCLISSTLNNPKQVVQRQRQRQQQQQQNNNK